jgi:ATP-dependent RNA helicase DeaD
VPLAEIAAALAVQTQGGEEFLMKEPPPEKRRERPERDDRGDRGDRERKPRSTRDDLATYRIAVGKRHKVMPGAIVGAIANEGGLNRSDFGHISIRVDHSLVELPAKLSKETLKKLESTRISGQLIHLELDKGGRSGGFEDRGGRPDRGSYSDRGGRQDRGPHKGRSRDDDRRGGHGESRGEGKRKYK